MEFNATFIVAFISFIIFIIIMNQILYKPINDIIQKRQNLIDKNYNDANKNIEKSKAILQDRLDKLQNARNRARQEASLAIDKVKSEKENREKEFKQKLETKVEQEINALNNEKQNAINTLKGDVINLAQIISDKFIEAPERIENIDNGQIEKIMQD